MKRTCATCHEVQLECALCLVQFHGRGDEWWPFLSGQHSSPHAPFCTVLGDSWSWAAECSSRVRVAGRGSAKEILLFALPEQEGALRVGHVASGWFGGAVRWLLHSGWHKLIPESQNDDEMAAHGDEHAAFRTAMGLGPEDYRPRPRVNESFQRLAQRQQSRPLLTHLSLTMILVEGACELSFRLERERS